jgi:3-deoxy-7-phosphoheptulonate synthase
MIIVMRRGASIEEVEGVIERVEGLGFKAHISRGEERTIIGLIGDERSVAPDTLQLWPGVEQALPVLRPFKLASRDFHPDNTVIRINGVDIGGKAIAVMAGPCAVENEEQIMSTARAVQKAGVRILRGGAFKPRTSPYSFQGLGEEGLKLLGQVRRTLDMAVITEVMTPEDVPLVVRYADILQVGARNVQNYRLLDAVGEAGHPVLLKRGMSTTIEELLMSAEYILSHGNERVMLCERGIRTFETFTRNTLDINAVPVIKQLSHLPVIVDPSHGTGRWELVGAISKAGVAAGADGLLVEVHVDPEQAVSDGGQSLRPERFSALMGQLRRVAEAVDREL